MNSGRSLDERYLDFIDKTDSVFTQYPQIEPLRYFIFRELLVQQRARSWKDIAKHWSRPIRHRPVKAQTPAQADVVLLVDGLREVIVDALLPVYEKLVSCGIKVALIGTGGASDLPGSAYYLQPASQLIPPRWAKSAWDALCDRLKQLRRRPLRRAFNDFCANVQGSFDGLDRMLDAIQPKVVLIASTQLPDGASLAVASRKRGILTLLLQHGILQPLYLPLITHHMVTWGQSSTDTLVDLGVASEKLIALGSPRHDSISPSGNGNAKGALLDALSLPHRPTFVFFSNGNDLLRNGAAPHECASWLETMAAQYSNDINVVIRLHPNENGSLYRNCRHLHITKESLSLALTLEGCDWLGSLCSTVLYDALLFGKPVWQFYAEGWPELANNWKQGLAVRIPSQEELIRRAQQMLSPGDDNFNNSLSGRVFANHGHAGQAIAHFIEHKL